MTEPDPPPFDAAAPEPAKPRRGRPGLAALAMVVALAALAIAAWSTWKLQRTSEAEQLARKQDAATIASLQSQLAAGSQGVFAILQLSKPANAVLGLFRFMGGIFLRALKHQGGALKRLLPHHPGALPGLRQNCLSGPVRLVPDQGEDGLCIHRGHLTA